MKNSLFVIAGLILIIWAILFFGFDTSRIVHLLLILAGFILLIRIVFNNKLSS